LGTSDQRQEKILALLQNHSMVYPQKYQAIDMQNLRWGEHLEASHLLSEQLGIQSPNPELSGTDYIEFPVGSMFWARADAIAPLLSGKLGIANFDPELGQTDHTLHHTIERNLARIALLSGKPIAVLENTAFENTYP
jgi:lipopolysaccharide biosynthesis protein